MKILSAEHLPRDLKIIGSIVLVFSFLTLLQIGFQDKWGLLMFFLPFTVGVSYFALASGVSKKEKWAWSGGLTFFGLLIISDLVTILLGLTSPLSIVIGILILIFFLFTFIKKSREIAINPISNIFPLIVVSIGILLVISSLALLIYNQIFFS